MKYKLFSKRGLALIVSLMMCLSAMSTTAWAGNFKDLQNLIDTTEADEDGIRNVTLNEDYTYGDESTDDNGTDDSSSKTITITEDKNVNLNLNGYTITGSKDSSVITVTGGDLTIRDEQSSTATDDSEAAPEKVGTITGGGGTKSWSNAPAGNLDGGGILIKDGNVTMEGGKITGNTADWGGGVMVRDGGTFELKGGEISDNTATNGGGGVYVRDDATLTISGGKITENSAGDKEKGGGVCLYDGTAGAGHLVMTGGEITGNISTTDETMDIAKPNGTVSSVDITGGTVSEYVYETYVDKNLCHEKDDASKTCKVGHQAVPVDKVDATCTANGHEAGTKCSVCDEILNGCEKITAQHYWTEVAEEPSTCTQTGHSSYKECSVCGDIKEKTDYDLAEHTPSGGQTIAPTCTEAGYTEAVSCSECGIELTARQEGDPAKGHTWGDWGEPVDGIQTRTCEVCGAEEQETATQPPVDPDPVDPVDPDPVDPVDPDPVDPDPVDPVDPDPVDPDPVDPDIPVLPETPELPDDGPDVPDDVVTIPDEDVPLGGEPAAAPVTIADEAVPLAGLLSLAQLLDELYRHEDRPAVDLPEGFPFASHEYAPAICWALDNALVVNTEAEPLDPDELLTVGLLRKVLTNYALLKGQEDFVVELTGEDDDLVLDLGERLTVFYAQLEAAE